MKTEFKRDPRLKLRAVMDRVAVDLGHEARKVINKKKIFTYFLFYRLAAAVAMPLIINMYLIIGRYVDSGYFRVSSLSTELFAVCLLDSLFIILVFRKKTRGLRHLIDSLVKKKGYDDEQIVKAYKDSFDIPAYITAWEVGLSVLTILVPSVYLSYMGLGPSDIAVKEIILAWWLGTLAMFITSFTFNQAWVEKTLDRLYDYGIRISSGAGRKRNADIYLRISFFMGSIIVTLILLYANMLYMLSKKIPGYTSVYMIQVAFMSAIILAGIYFFFRMIFSSIKRSFDILDRKMKLVQGGDYSVRILNHRDDQIGQLYDDFDYLVSTLNNVLMSLEREVQRRTAKLEEVTSKISKYVSPQLYSKIYSEDSELTLSYTRKKLTIFFSDIVGFTGISENLAPEDLSRILNQYLDAMAEISLKWGGTIDKYIGDAIMVFFGDPEFTDDRDHAVRCVNMALEMLGRLEHLQVEWESSGITFPLHIRIGINTGFCTVGNFGSESRMDYTVIGGAVNMASRLQSAAGVDGILISETTYLLVKDGFQCTDEGSVTLKGIEHPVRTWSVSGSITQSTGLTDVHLPGLDLRLDPSGMTEESRLQAIDILKRASGMLGK